MNPWARRLLSVIAADSMEGRAIWFPGSDRAAKYIAEQMRAKKNNPEFQYEIACAQLCGLGHFRMRGFVTVLPPDEFQILLNADGAPALGTLTVIRCKRPEYHHGVAGVHVNAILESVGDEALLQPTWHIDGSVEYHCPATDVRVLWKDGKFIPL